MSWPLRSLGDFMPPRLGTVDPSRYIDEEFDLFSIPAYEREVPDRLLGRDIGSSKQIVLGGDVLFSRIVPHIRRAWIVPPENGNRSIGSGEWIVFRGDGVDPTFLRQFLLSDAFNAQVMRTLAGVGGSLMRARPSEVAKIKIPLPPLEEQKRIAAILDKADAIRRKREQAIKLADEFLRSLFLDMFGDPVANPKGWQVHRLGQLLKLPPQIGTIRPVTGDGTFKVIRVGEIGQRSISLGLSGKTLATMSELERFTLSDGDVLLARAIGSEDHLGKASIFVEQPERVLFDSHVMRLRLDQQLILPDYFREWLSTKGGRANFMRCAGRTAVQFNINGEQIQRVEVPLPPVILQAKFVTALRCIIGMIDKPFPIKALAVSLTKRAFSGNL